MKIIKKMFIKDYQNTTDKNVRFKYGVVASVFGIITNIILFIGKLFAGLVSGSITIISDAINNLTDSGSSTISLIGFKLSAKPADKDHPFGHARYEYITGLLVAVVILVIGVFLCKESIEKIITPTDVLADTLIYIILSVAVVMKFFQFLLYRNFAKTINSDTLMANAVDSRNDTIITCATLITTIVMATTGLNIDGYVGLALAIFVLVSGIKLFAEIINPLLGSAPDKEFVKKVKDKILSYNGILGMHELLLHSYGQDNYYGSVHVEVSADGNSLEIHEIVDDIEKDVWEEFGLRLVIHTDPIENNNKEVMALRNKLQKCIKQLDEKLSIHDFRMVKGKQHTNLVFDIEEPFDISYSKEKIEEHLNNHFQNDKMKYYFVFNIDKVCD